MKKLISISVLALILFSAFTSVSAAVITDDSYYSYEFFSDNFESYTRDQVLPLTGMHEANPGFNYKTDAAQPEGARASVVEAPIEAEKYGNVVKLGYSRGIDNYFVTPYGMTQVKYDIGEVNKVKVSLSIMLDGYAAAHLRVLGSDASARGGTYFWSIGSDGTMALDTGTEGVGGTPSNAENYEKYKTYELNQWYFYELYLDFTSHTFDLYINGDEITANHSFGERLKDFCVFRIQIDSRQNAEDEEGTALLSNLYIDNWKYEFPMYLNVSAPENDGFTQPIADLDFDSLTVGETYTSDVNNIRIGNTSALVESEENRGNVLRFNATTSERAIVGTPSDWMNRFVSENGITPKIIKAETNVKLSNENSKKFAAYVEFMGRKPGTEDEIETAYMASFLSSGKLRIGRSEQGDTPVELNYELDTWYHFEFYIDAESGIYKAYVNDDYIGEFLLNTSGKSPITQPLQIRVTSNGNAQSDVNFIYTDKITMYTLPCYAENVISQYKTQYNDRNAAYCMEADEESGASALFVTAVYDADGKLTGISSESISAEAGGKIFKKINIISDTAQAPEQKVFVIRDYGSIEPLAKSIVVK